MSNLVHPELSYQVMGILFKVHSKLGGSFEEKYYQRAVEELLTENKIAFKRELKLPILIGEHTIGKFFLDFLIADKIVLELKTVPVLLPIHFRQVRSYLKVNNLELGILANFRGESLQYKRILSPVN